ARARDPSGRLAVDNEGRPARNAVLRLAGSRGRRRREGVGRIPALVAGVARGDAPPVSPSPVPWSYPLARGDQAPNEVDIPIHRVALDTGAVAVTEPIRHSSTRTRVVAMNHGARSERTDTLAT